MHKEIKNWLSGNRGFLPGLRIYRQILGKYPLSIFTGYERANFIPPVVMARLVEAFRIYLRDVPEQPAPSAESSESIIVHKVVTSATAEPEVIQSLRLSARSLHKQHAHMKSQLIAATTDKDRYGYARGIMEEIIPSLDAIYDQIRNWEETKELPAVIASKPDDRYKKINSIAPRISKLKKILKDETLSPQKRQKYEKELIDKELLLAKLKAKWAGRNSLITKC